MRKAARPIGLFTAFVMLFTFMANCAFMTAPLTAYAEETDTADNAVTEEVPEEAELPEFTPNFTLPKDMKGIYLTPTVDFATSEGQSEEELLSEIGKVLDNVTEKGLNTVIVRTSFNGNRYYSTEINDSIEKTPTEYLVHEAKERGLYVFAVFDINSALCELEDATLQERIDNLALQTHAFAFKYRVDGILLDGYYSKKSESSYSDYVGNGSGIGFENWLRDNGAYVFSLVSDAVRKTSNSLPVGISLTDIWANYSEENPDGSKTSVNFEALTDGYTDTVGYIEKGFADFMMVVTDSSLSDTSQPFEEVVTWWSHHAKSADIPLYVAHSNDKIDINNKSWAQDQIVKQLITAKSIDCYNGSAFLSLSALDENRGESTTALLKYYSNTLDEDSIFKDLVMTLPQKTTFTTYDDYVIFQGSFDKNFDVYFNGEKIELNEAGNFYYKEDLKVGSNKFTIKNKATTYVYNITRKVEVLKSVEPAVGTMEVEGGTTIVLSAIAYRGSAVSAKINGKNIKLTEVEGQVEGLDVNASYTKFTGTYTVPNGIIKKEQNLGQVVFYGSYMGFDESAQSATVKVMALPEIANAVDGDLLQILGNNTMVYNPKTTDSVPSANLARLPKGTLDYVTKTVTYSGTKYYLTYSGKRIKAEDAKILANYPLGTNSLKAVSNEKDGTDTVIKFSITSRTPFSMDFSPITYTPCSNGNYSVSEFSATSVILTFDYVTDVSGSFNFADSAMFKSAKWTTKDVGGVTKYQLKLELRQAGIFSGITAYYDDNGCLTFRFNGARKSLNGAVVVVDPGHGVKGSGIDPGAVGHITELSAITPISKLVTKKLKAAGATVIRFDTEAQYYDTYKRSSIARQYNPDVYISIHANSAKSASACGQEAYYFTPFSQPLASAVSASMAKYFKNNVYGGANHNRGAKYDYFAVTLQQDFPSILLEMGFVTNYTDAMALANATHQEGIAEAIVQGIANYLAQCKFSTGGSGGGVTSSDEEPIEEVTTTSTEETTAPPAETAAPFEETTITTAEPYEPDEPDEPEEPAQTEQTTASENSDGESGGISGLGYHDVGF